MPLAILVALAATSSLELDGVGPLAWSPDSRWIAYSDCSGPLAPVDPAWVLFPDDLLFTSRGSDAVKEGGHAPDFSLWAICPVDGEKRVLERSLYPIGAPGWSRDGLEIAYLRRAPENALPTANESVVLELIARGAEPESRVIWSRALPGSPSPRVDEAARWSPDGRMIAFALTPMASVVVVDARDGTVVAEIERASHPSWRGDSRQLAFLRGSADGSFGALGLWESSEGLVREIALTAEAAAEAPTWMRNGRSVLVLAGQPAADGQVQVILHQIDVRLGRMTPVKPIDNPVLPPERLLNMSMAIGGDALHQYYSIAATGRDAAITQHRGRAPMDRFQPLAGDFQVLALSLSPDGGQIGLRLWSAKAGALSAVLDVTTRELTPIAPDPAARDRWLTLLIGSARSLLDPSRQPPAAEGRARQPLPTLLPTAGWSDGTDPIANRFRKIARLAVPLLGELRGGASEDPFHKAARIVFEVAEGKSEDALRGLRQLEPWIERPELRDRLLGLRAQLELEVGDREVAEARLDYLEQRRRRPVFRFAESGHGGRVIEEVDAGDDWVESLRNATSARPDPSSSEPPMPSGFPALDSGLTFPDP